MMEKRAIALAAVLALAAACTGGGGGARSPAASPTSEAWRGGTLRLALVGDFPHDLDPQKEYYSIPWELFRCCLLRTLFSYNGLSASEGGAEARPDLAAGPPEVSADGLTWTIHIKPGIHYAAPLDDVEITAQDVVRALMRLASPVTIAKNPYNYAFHYSVIEGFDDYRAGSADTISGLETPDEHTLVVRLIEPAGDLPYRFALPATAPIPPNPYRRDAVLGAAEGHPHSTAACVEDGVWISCGYGHFLVASGPYMIEGSQDLDLSVPPRDQEPIAGFSTPRYEERLDWNPSASGSLTLVRNPSWDPATDDLRAAYADRIEVELRGWADPGAANAELAAGVESGTVDLVPDLTHTPREVRGYRADPEMEGRVLALPSGYVYYIVMNLAVPPFEDIHVRRSVSFAIDRFELARTVVHDPASIEQGGVVATHIAPDALERNLLQGYDPYPPSLDRARQEMALSRYDRDRDGTCDAAECRGVPAIVPSDRFGSAAADELVAWLAAVGIHLRVRAAPWDELYRRVWNERARLPLLMGLRWAYDYPNASGVFPPLFASSSITESFNESLLGAAPSQLERWGYQVRVPSADDRIDRCMAMTGLDQTGCWADLDRYLMERVVPVVPFLATQRTSVVSKRIASYSYSPATVNLAIDRMSLVPGSE